MELKLTFGVDLLVFGMKPQNVEAILGKPNATYFDEDKNTIYVYDDKKLKLTFYVDEDLKFGYLVTTNMQVRLFGNSIIGEKNEVVFNFLKQNKISHWEKSTEDGIDTYFNEETWLSIHTEFNEVTRIELGAAINLVTDELEWKF